VIVLLVLCLLFLNRGVQPDPDALYQYTVKERNSSAKVILKKNGMSNYQWIAVSEGANPLTIKDRSSKQKGIFVVLPGENGEGGSVRFQLKNVENSFDCLYDVTLSFYLDDDEHFVCSGHTSRELGEKLEGGAAEGLPYYIAEDPAGGINVCLTDFPEGGGEWIPSADETLTVEGPISEEDEHVLRFHVTAVYENGAPTPGEYEISLICREMKKELRMKIAVDANGEYTLSEAQVSDAEVEPTALEAQELAFAEQYGWLSVFSEAESVSCSCRNYWFPDDETELEKKNGRALFTVDGVSWILYLSDELSVDEISAEVKAVASTSEKCTVGSAAGTLFTSEKICAVAWKSGSRSYLLSLESADTAALIEMAQRVTE